MDVKFKADSTETDNYSEQSSVRNKPNNVEIFTYSEANNKSILETKLEIIKAEVAENTITPKPKQEYVHIKLEFVKCNEFDIKESAIINNTCFKNNAHNSNVGVPQLQQAVFMFQCGICRSKHPSQRILIRHMRYRHGHKVLQCELCDYICGENYCLKTHMLVHSKPLQCEECDYKCKRKPTMNKHKVRHLNDRKNIMKVYK